MTSYSDENLSKLVINSDSKRVYILRRFISRLKKQQQKLLQLLTSDHNAAKLPCLRGKCGLPVPSELPTRYFAPTCPSLRPLVKSACTVCRYLDSKPATHKCHATPRPLRLKQAVTSHVTRQRFFLRLENNLMMLHLSSHAHPQKTTEQKLFKFCQSYLIFQLMKFRKDCL